MPDKTASTRRAFLAASGTAAAATMLSGTGTWAAASAKRRVALVGTGIRGTTMWGKDVVARYSDVVEFVGLCDVNPLRGETGKRALGVSCPTFTSLDQMLDAVKPESLIVTTVCATHASCSTGVTMSYSLNAAMPIEGYRLAFNGTKGRLEVRDFERQPFPAPEETEIYVIKNFGTREKIEIPKAEGGHGGGDDRLRDLIFRNPEVPAYMRLPDSRAGAMSCLTGVAALHSMEQDRPVKISDLLGA